MKAVIPVTCQKGEYLISARFGRSSLFAVTEDETRTYYLLKSPVKSKSAETGKKVLETLIKNEKVDTIIAFEIGLYVQQYAAKTGMRIILISDKYGRLDDLMDLMGMKKSYQIL